MSVLRQTFDELTHSADKWENYFEVYENHLVKLMPEKELNIVEVGVQKGGSLEMWRDYFEPYVKVTGIDVDPECAKLDYRTSDIQVVIGDQGDATFWDSFLTQSGPIDLFIDDGSHHVDHQILTFEKVFPKMPVGSLYICEDTHSSYMRFNGGGLDVRSSFINYAKGYIDVLHYDWKEETNSELEHKVKIGKDLTSVHFYDSIVVFEKFGKRKMQRVFPKQFNGS